MQAISFTDSTIEDNIAGVHAGGVGFPDAADITIDGTMIDGNTCGDTGLVTSNGGGIYATIGTAHSLEITGSTISNNNTSAGGGTRNGGGVYLTTGTSGILTVAGSTISGNIADDSGGGFHVTTGGTSTVDISDTTISGNLTNLTDGGGVYLVTGNSGIVTVANSTISGNVADDDGGGLWVDTGTTSTVDISDTTFFVNSTNTLHGGGLYYDIAAGSTASINRVTFDSNYSTSSGGAIHDSSSGAQTTSILNSTIFLNAAGTDGGGLATNAAALGVFFLNNVTINGNYAAIGGTGNGGGLARLGSATVNVANTIIAGNFDLSGAPIVPDCSTSASIAIVTEGHNLIGVGDVGSCTDFVNTVDGDKVGTSMSPLDAEIAGALASNGGTTQTLLAGTGSPVLNAGNAGIADGLLDGALRHCVSADQAGSLRPISMVCDIGALEGGCDDGVVTPSLGEDCESPFGPCCDSATCLFTSGNECQAAGANPTCDPADTCNGLIDACPVNLAPSLTACGDMDTTFCNAADSCDGAGTCVDRKKDGGTVCLPGTGTCNPDDTCDGTTDACAVVLTAAATPCGSASTTECDDPDTCNGTGSCQVNNKANTVSCSTDGNLCTNDLCNGSGTCGHPNNTASCDDGQYCTDVDVCSGGSCSGQLRICSDGNQCTADSCNEATDACVHVNNTLPCNGDGVECTENDVCVDGTCQVGPPNDALCGVEEFCSPSGCKSFALEIAECPDAPSPDCLAPSIEGYSKFDLKDADPNSSLKWKWLKGEQTDYAALGDPVTSTLYFMCLYEDVDGTPLLSEYPIPTTGWTATGSNGFRYKSSGGSGAGITSVKLKSGDSPSPSVFVRGKGSNLTVPSVPLTLEVILELRNSEGTCWSNSFSNASKNADGRFKATAD